jgi:hypothetical protein
VCAHADPAPLVLLLCGPRPPGLEQLIAGADAVIVVAEPGEDEEVARLVAGRCRRAGQRGGVLALRTGPAAVLAERLGAARSPAREASRLLEARAPVLPAGHEVAHAPA